VSSLSALLITPMACAAVAAALGFPMLLLLFIAYAAGVGMTSKAGWNAISPLIDDIRSLRAKKSLLTFKKPAVRSDQSLDKLNRFVHELFASRNAARAHTLDAAHIFLRGLHVTDVNMSNNPQWGMWGTHLAAMGMHYAGIDSRWDVRATAHQYAQASSSEHVAARMRFFNANFLIAHPNADP